MNIAAVKDYVYKCNRILEERAHYTKIYKLSSIKLLSMFSYASILIMLTVPITVEISIYGIVKKLV